MDIIYLECECNCSEHLIRFISYEGEEEIYIEYYLNPELSFWKRLKIAIRYLFNRKCKFGAFDVRSNYIHILSKLFPLYIHFFDF